MKAPANPAKVKALLDLGASLIANHVHRVCPEVAAVAHMLEREFAARVAANVYCSFKGVQAFQTHFDLHDVFAVQAEGEKSWRVYESRADAPVMPLPPGDEIEKWLTASRGRLLFEANMKPGDILYLPRGQYHDALTGAQASLHVTFGVSRRRPASRCSSCWRARSRRKAHSAHYLPDARNEAELRERLAKLAERVRAVMTSPAFAIDVLNHQRGLAERRGGLRIARAAAADLVFDRATARRSCDATAAIAAVFERGEIALGATLSDGRMDPASSGCSRWATPSRASRAWIRRSFAACCSSSSPPA